MDIDLDALQAAIAAEVRRREFERLAEDRSPPPRPGGLVDGVRAFEPIDLEGYLPEPQHEPQHIKPELVAELLPDGRLSRLLRREPFARQLQRPRFYSLLTRASRLPGGATYGNMAYLIGRGIANRIPWLARLLEESKQWRYLPGRLAGFEYQANRGLYAHALATQHNDEYLLNRLQRLEQQVRQLHAAAGQGEPVHSRAAAGATLPADLLAAIEERFGPPPGDQLRCLASQLPLIRAVAALHAEPVLELQCDSGERLQLLRESGVPVVGVDDRPDRVQACRDAGFEVALADSLDHLACQPDQSLAGLVAGQLAERLAPAGLVRLLDEARRSVRSGGFVLFEATQTQRLAGALGVQRLGLVPAELPSGELLAFLLEARGFHRIGVQQHPCADDSQPTQAVCSAIGYVP